MDTYWPLTSLKDEGNPQVHHVCGGLSARDCIHSRVIFVERGSSSSSGRCSFNRGER